MITQLTLRSILLQEARHILFKEDKIGHKATVNAKGKN